MMDKIKGGLLILVYLLSIAYLGWVVLDAATKYCVEKEHTSEQLNVLKY